MSWNPLPLLRRKGQNTKLETVDKLEKVYQCRFQLDLKAKQLVAALKQILFFQVLLLPSSLKKNCNRILTVLTLI